MLNTPVGFSSPCRRLKEILMSCYNHPNTSSVTTCSNCGKDICAACVTHFNENVVCRDCADLLRKEVPQSTPEAETVETPVAKAAETPAAKTPEMPAAKAAETPVEKTVAKPAAPAPAAPSKETMPAPVPESKPTVVTAPASQPPAEKPLPVSVPAEQKQPILSLLLSVVVPGLGQIYNKQVKKGIILLAGYVLLWLVVIVLNSRSHALCCLIFWIPLVVLLFAAYDAYSTTKKTNEGQAVTDWLS
jgi:TM2 domain-containing membrane protein YozV